MSAPAVRCTIEIKVLDYDDEESRMLVTIKPNGLGRGCTYNDALPVTVEDWMMLHDIVKMV